MVPVRPIGGEVQQNRVEVRAVPVSTSRTRSGVGSFGEDSCVISARGKRGRSGIQDGRIRRLAGPHAYAEEADQRPAVHARASLTLGSRRSRSTLRGRRPGHNRSTGTVADQAPT